MVPVEITANPMFGARNGASCMVLFLSNVARLFECFDVTKIVTGKIGIVH